MLMRLHCSPHSEFRHVLRSLQPGESVPPPPSLLEQLSACRMAAGTPVEAEEEELPSGEE